MSNFLIKFSVWILISWKRDFSSWDCGRWDWNCDAYHINRIHHCPLIIRIFIVIYICFQLNNDFIDCPLARQFIWKKMQKSKQNVMLNRWNCCYVNLFVIRMHTKIYVFLFVFPKILILLTIFGSIDWHPSSRFAADWNSNNGVIVSIFY